MAMELGYVTNEVEGSFWRPHDYMMKVPGAHIIGKEGNGAAAANENVGDASVAASMKISAEGRKLAQMGKQMNDNRDDVVMASEDGVVRRYSFNIASNDLSLVDITA